jgi:hypothetical protein
MIGASPTHGAATRTAIVIDQQLAIGFAANAAAVVALSLGAHRPELPGADLVDAAGRHHAGLFPAGLPIPAGTAAEIAGARELAADQHEVLVIDFPSDGQTTTDYAEFRRLVAGKQPDELRYLGMALHGPTDIIRSLTKRFSLLR